MLGSTSEDYRHAAREWEAFKQGGVPEVKPLVDNHTVHMLAHQKVAKTDLFMSMPDDQQKLWLNHLVHHFEQMSGGAGQPAPMSPGGGAQPNPAGSKANEQGDQTMNTLRQGGSQALGSGGNN